MEDAFRCSCRLGLHVQVEQFLKTGLGSYGECQVVFNDVPSTLIFMRFQRSQNDHRNDVFFAVEAAGLAQRSVDVVGAIPRPKAESR